MASMSMERRRTLPTRGLFISLLPALAAGWGAACKTDDQCQAKLSELVGSLDQTHSDMKGKHQTLRVLEDLRGGVLSGKRFDMPSAQKQYLEKSSSLLNEITFDARHKPLSTNVSRHFTRLRTLAPTQEVQYHTFMPLKKSTSSSSKGQASSPGAVLVVIDKKSLLSIYTLEGDALLENFDLGHGPGRSIAQVALSPSQDVHFIATGDDLGIVRVHNLKVVVKRVRKEKPAQKEDGQASAVAADEESSAGSNESGEEETKPKRQQLIVTTNFSSSFQLTSGSGEARKLNSLLPVDRGTQTYFVTGDSLGGISVFYRNGTIKGRVRVTEDVGGVTGLLRGQGQSILFYSSHSFGFFSVSQIDVQYPPCTGWNAPLFDVAVDPSLSYSRVILALADGDVLVFSTTRGKSKACDLTLKFPRVSALPFKLHVLKGHILGLPVPTEDAQKAQLRELFFFNTAAMDGGYGVAPSRTVTLQASFKPKQPEAFALHGLSGNSAGLPGDRAKSQIALRFQDTLGVDLFELSLKPPSSAAPKPSGIGGVAGMGGGGNGGGGSGDDGSSWLTWFPKIGVFGIALIGVVIWNVRKVSGQRKSGGLDDFDDEVFKERIRERKRMKAEKDKTEAAESGGGASGGLAPPDED